MSQNHMTKYFHKAKEQHALYPLWLMHPWRLQCCFVPINTLHSEMCTVYITSPSLSLSPVELNKGKLQFHSELIEALQQFAVQHGRATDETTEVKTREHILEQALVEQNQILEVMQKLITSLEMENKSSREKINSQAKKISEMTVWEARAKRAEDQLRDMANSGVMGSSKAGMISFAAIAGFEKVLAEKDQLIASLQAKLESIPLELRHRVIHEDKPASSALIASARAKLEVFLQSA